MSAYTTLVSSRTTAADPASLSTALKAIDPTIGWQMPTGDASATYTLKKATAWTAPEIALAQAALDTAPAASAQLSAKAEISAMSIFQQAILLMLLDEINAVRALLPVPQLPITKSQALQKTLTKAGTL